MASKKALAIIIRPPTEADCPSAAACQIACYKEAYSKILPKHLLDAFAADVPGRIASWKERINTPELTTLLAFNNENEVIGFSTAYRLPDKQMGKKELYSLYVRQAWQGQGLGTRLMDEVLGEEGIPAVVWVLEKNISARRFYVSKGFGAEPRARRFASQVEGWIVMLDRE